MAVPRVRGDGVVGGHPTPLRRRLVAWLQRRCPGAAPRPSRGAADDRTPEPSQRKESGMATTTTNDIQELHKHLEGIRYTMFTTRFEGGMRSRPMTTIETEEGSDRLLFLGNDGSELLADIATDPHVNLAYADNDGAKYVSVSGTATSRDDRATVKELWNPILNAWWDGPEDPAIRVIEVRIEAAEYWAGPGSRLVRLVGIAAAVMTGDEYDEGEHGTVDPNGTTRA
jgi:general stress protein 26